MEHIYYPLTPEIERLGEEEVFKPVPPEVKAELRRRRRERERQEQQKQKPPQEEPEAVYCLTDFLGEMVSVPESKVDEFLAEQQERRMQYIIENVPVSEEMARFMQETLASWNETHRGGQ